MLVIDPGTMRLPLRSAGEQCSPLHALYSFCIIPKSNPVLQGIFCLGGDVCAAGFFLPPQAALALGRAAGSGRAFAGPAAAGGAPARRAGSGRPRCRQALHDPAGRPAAGKFSRCINSWRSLPTRWPRTPPCGSLSAAGGASPASPRRGSWPGASAVSRWPARTPRRGMPSSTRAGGTRGSLPARTATPALWKFFRRCRALQQLCRVGHAGAVGSDRPARRLHADGRGHRDHRGRGLAGHTGHRARPRRRRPDRAGPADRHRRFVGHGLFREKVIAFSSNFGYNK